jgi:hypothetical protein
MNHGDAWSTNRLGCSHAGCRPIAPVSPSPRGGGTISDIAGIDASGPDAQASADNPPRVPWLGARIRLHFIRGNPIGARLAVVDLHQDRGECSAPECAIARKGSLGDGPGAMRRWRARGHPGGKPPRITGPRKSGGNSPCRIVADAAGDLTAPTDSRPPAPAGCAKMDEWVYFALLHPQIPTYPPVSFALWHYLQNASGSAVLLMHLSQSLGSCSLQANLGQGFKRIQKNFSR